MSDSLQRASNQAYLYYSNFFLKKAPFLFLSKLLTEQRLYTYLY